MNRSSTYARDVSTMIPKIRWSTSFSLTTRREGHAQLQIPDNKENERGRQVGSLFLLSALLSSSPHRASAADHGLDKGRPVTQLVEGPVLFVSRSSSNSRVVGSRPREIAPVEGLQAMELIVGVVVIEVLAIGGRLEAQKVTGIFFLWS